MSHANAAKKLMNLLELKGEPVGVKFFKENTTEIQPSEEKRFCQAVLKASNGEKLLIKLFNRCFTPNILFGFRDSKLYKKKTLKKFGYKYVNVTPLTEIGDIDAILLIVNPYQVMQLIVAFNQILKKKLQFNVNGKAAVCGDVALTTVLLKKPTISFMCFGARIYNDFDKNDIVFGIPPNLLSQLIKKLEINAGHLKTIEKYDKEFD